MAVVRFVAAGLVVLGLLAFAAESMSRRTAHDEAISRAKEVTDVLARTLVGPTLADPDPAAWARFDAIVRSRVLNKDLVRIKLWSADGQIRYSDVPALVGSRYQLGKDEQEILREGGVAADVSDLQAPENRYERPYKKLLEVYERIGAPNQPPLLFETYFLSSSVSADARHISSRFAKTGLLALLVLELVQIPLALALARRLRQREFEREALLQRALDASDAERRRIARDLHDGVVQDLVAVSLNLASGEVDDAAAGTRRSIGSLRSLIVDIYPPSLHAAGLDAALADLLAGAANRGLQTRLSIAPDLSCDPECEAMIYRVAQEAVRNVIEHARATSVGIEVARRDGRLAMEVCDDGRGFSHEELARRMAEGHVGLQLSRDLATTVGGELVVDSAPARGTTVRLEVPVP